MSAWVYIVRAGEHVKIGWARDVARRLRSIQTGNVHELELLGVTPGANDVETILHHRFAAHRVRGEWFTAHSSILEFAASLPPQTVEWTSEYYQASKNDLIIAAIRPVIDEATSLVVRSWGVDPGVRERALNVLNAAHAESDERIRFRMPLRRVK